MCLYIKPYTRRRIAKRDISVFKVLRQIDGCLVSPYQRHTSWKQGETRRVKLEHEVPRDKRWCWHRRQINIGLHALKTFDDAMRFAKRCRGSIHVYRCIEMVVPKGSAYYIGTKGDIVSSQLRWPT